MTPHGPQGPQGSDVLGALERWLGTDLFNRDAAPFYLAAFRDITTASMGLLPDGGGHALIGWDAFEAYLDGYATDTLKPLVPGRVRRSVHRPRASAADPPGFVSCEMVAPAFINTASVKELRTVPGIGTRLARRVVEERERSGPFTRIDQLINVPGFSRESYELAAPYLAASSKEPALTYHALQDLSSIRFPAYVRFLHRTDMLLPGRSYSTGSVPLAALAVEEMSLAAARARSAPYWQPHRSADPTSIRLRQQDVEWDRSAVRVKRHRETCKVAPVTNSRYLAVVRSLIESASESIRISMHLMRLGSPMLTQEVLEPLIAASARRIEVQILLNSDQGELGRADRDAIARLQKTRIPVRTDRRDVMMHRKAVIFDQDCLLIGSHNLTPHSIFRSEELSLFVQNEELAASEADHFDRLWHECEQAHGGEWPERSAEGARP